MADGSEKFGSSQPEKASANNREDYEKGFLTPSEDERGVGIDRTEESLRELKDKLKNDTEEAGKSDDSFDDELLKDKNGDGINPDVSKLKPLAPERVSDNYPEGSLEVGKLVDLIIGRHDLGLGPDEIALGKKVSEILRGNHTPKELENFPEKAISAARDIENHVNQVTRNEKEIENYVTKRLNG